MAAAQIVPIRQNSEAPHWSLATRIAFRLCFVYFSLYCLLTQIIGGLFPFPNLDIPDPGTLPPIRQIVFWTAGHLFHAKLPLVYTGSGSGDKTFDWVQAVFLLIFSALVTCAWSVIDRKRESHTTLHKWFRLFLRFAFAGQMFVYGSVKLIPLQMPFPYLKQLVEPFGNLSPMGLLWSSVGASPAYESFTGCAEIFGGLLLIIPRTVTLGALICLSDATLIFVLNMTYDVPVKLFSFHLILMALFLLAPEFDRLTDFFFRNRMAEPSTQNRLFATSRANTIAFTAQVAFGLLLLGLNLYDGSKDWHTYGGGRPKSPLYGIWNIDQLSIDGQLRSPLLTDNDRFHRAIFDFPNFMSFQRMNGSYAYYSAAIDTKNKTIALTKGADKNSKDNFTFEHLGPDQLILDGTMNQHRTHMQLKREDHTKFLLLARGFHWIQEYPFNR